jgi:hypothetical protein
VELIGLKVLILKDLSVRHPVYWYTLIDMVVDENQWEG